MYARRHLSRRRQCWTTTTRTTEPGWLRPETAIGKYFSRKRLISFASRCGFVSARMQTCAAPINILTHNSLMRAFSFTAQLHVVQISINFFLSFFVILQCFRSMACRRKRSQTDIMVWRVGTWKTSSRRRRLHCRYICCRCVLKV